MRRNVCGLLRLGCGALARLRRHDGKPALTHRVAFGYWTSQYAQGWQGFSIAYGTGLWPWLVTSSLLGLLLSNAFWGWTLTADAWQPTFAAFVSRPSAMVLLFGGGWKVTLNGAPLGALLVTPSCLLIVNYLCIPLGLPVVIGNVLGMAAVQRS